MTENTLLETYHQVPYPHLVFGQTHPNRLATVATLLGLNPPPIDRCRCLEIGCATGSNLIPMTCGLPESEFVGLDFAANQIEIGQTTVEALNLTNISLHCKNILDVSADLGQFDYIIAHGVYSWVPAPVRDKLLAICKENLTPNGIAYISYNTYPGWHISKAFRHIMRYQGRHHTDPQTRAEKARDALHFLAEAMPEDHFYNDAIAEYLKTERLDDGFLLHGPISEVNDPVYFHQFIEHITQHNLRYVGDAEILGQAPPPIQAQLQQMLSNAEDSDTFVETEQYMDYLLNRAFRQSLLCHATLSPKPTLDATRLENLYFLSRAELLSPEVDLETETPIHFQNAKGTKISMSHPLSKAAMLHLHHIYPKTVHYKDLCHTAWDMLPSTAQAADFEEEKQRLRQGLLEAYIHNRSWVDLFTAPPKVAAAVKTQPLSSAIARYQASHSHKVTNLYHERVPLDDTARFILSQLDGTHALETLAQKLSTWMQENKVLIKVKGQSDYEAYSEKVAPEDILKSYLQHLLKMVLLLD